MKEHITLDKQIRSVSVVFGKIVKNLSNGVLPVGQFEEGNSERMITKKRAFN